ncbi:MAG: AAA family ATPase [Pseudomonadota bacterium]
MDSNDILCAQGKDALREHWDRGHGIRPRRDNAIDAPDSNASHQSDTDVRCGRTKQASTRFPSGLYKWRTYQYRRATAILPRTSTPYLIKGWVNERDFGLIYGAAGSGKSLFAAYLALKIARGEDKFFGKRIRGAPVVYFCLEGQGGFANRIVGLQQTYGRANDLHIVEQDFDMANAHDIEGVIAVVREIRAKAVFIDTWAQATPGMDEASSQDNGRAMQGINRIRESTGAAVIAVDHTGWSEGGAQQRPRGWSGKWAATDFALHVDGDIKSGDVAVVPRRLKDGTDYAPVGIGSEAVLLGEDDDGDPIVTFVALERDKSPLSSMSRKGPRRRPTRATQTGQAAFSEILASRGFEHSVMGDGPIVRAVSVDTVRDEFYRRYPTGEDAANAHEAKRKAFRRFLDDTNNGFAFEDVKGKEVMWRVATPDRSDLSGQERQVSGKPSQSVKDNDPDRHGHTPIGVSGCPVCPDSLSPMSAKKEEPGIDPLGGDSKVDAPRDQRPGPNCDGGHAGSAVSMFPVLSELEPKPEPCALVNADDGLHSRTRGQAKRLPPGELKRTIVALFMTSDAPLRMEDVLATLPNGTKRDSVRGIVQKLVRSGRLKVVAPGTYVMPMVSAPKTSEDGEGSR